ncbi:MAG: RAD55 family ATPase [Thermoprotei archaeon]
MERFKIPFVKTGISLLDTVLYKGFPLNSFITISGEGGIGKTFMLQQLAINFLRRGFSVIYLVSDDTPRSVIQNMSITGWNINKYIKAKRVIFIDCITLKIRKPIEEETSHIVYVENPKNLPLVTSTLFSVVENLSSPKAIVLIDSLTELMSSAEPLMILDAVKSIRENIAKAKKIPLFASVHFGIKGFDEIEQIIDYLVDGIIDLRYDPYLMQQGILVRQIRVRKIKGAPHKNQWIHYKIERSGISALSKDELTKLMKDLNMIV